MYFTRYCSGWPVTAALVATALALPSPAAPLSFDEALRLSEAKTFMPLAVH
ncbi:hypothetical protein [Pseudomonas turukhanskensis]|uniref:Uncharacterized protein n=1 Tax=Pseudomonas turukhanskensis TaxID=1806536 RepID=A0A9W6K9J9_9PSED|nr:hypothetical protein [Pseudomonas turukhanskensis]GLK90771.1 hypothetical protein GCM10017655_38350 [Pseudomonas turukhanskensis]